MYPVSSFVSSAQRRARGGRVYIIFGSPVSVPSVAHLDLGGAVLQLRSHRRWLCALPRDPPVAKARSRGARLVALVHVVT